MIAIKDCYKNVNDAKKVKVLTKGKKYIFIRNGYNVMVVNDLNEVSTFKSSIFITTLKDRNTKLDILGI